MRIRNKRLSVNRIYLSRAEMKHSNNKVIITLYTYNRTLFRNGLTIIRKKAWIRKNVSILKKSFFYGIRNLSRKIIFSKIFANVINPFDGLEKKIIKTKSNKFYITNSKKYYIIKSKKYYIINLFKNLLNNFNKSSNNIKLFNYFSNNSINNLTRIKPRNINYKLMDIKKILNNYKSKIENNLIYLKFNHILRKSLKLTRTFDNWTLNEDFKKKIIPHFYNSVTEKSKFDKLEDHINNYIDYLIRKKLIYNKKFIISQKIINKILKVISDDKSSSYIQFMEKTVSFLKDNLSKNYHLSKFKRFIEQYINNTLEVIISKRELHNLREKMIANLNKTKLIKNNKIKLKENKNKLKLKEKNNKINLKYKNKIKLAEKIVNLKYKNKINLKNKKIVLIYNKLIKNKLHNNLFNKKTKLKKLFKLNLKKSYFKNLLKLKDLYKLILNISKKNLSNSIFELFNIKKYKNKKHKNKKYVNKFRFYYFKKIYKKFRFLLLKRKKLSIKKKIELKIDYKKFIHKTKIINNLQNIIPKNFKNKYVSQFKGLDKIESLHNVKTMNLFENIINNEKFILMTESDNILKKRLNIIIPLYTYYVQMIYINKYKYKNWFLFELKNILHTIYQKKVEFNIINLKYVHLNSDIISESIAIKLKNRKNRLLRVLRKLFKLIKIRPLYFFLKNKLSLYNYKTWTVNSNIKKEKLKMQKVLYYLKNKRISGIRLEAAGRLTKRLTASRSLFKTKHKGSLKNIDSSYKGQSSILLRGFMKPNIQYSQINSKTRNGAFGLKTWISSY
jgi:hypothetical protein